MTARRLSGRGETGLLLVGASLLFVGAGSAIVFIEIFRYLAVTATGAVLLAASIAAMLAGGAAILASWRGLGVDALWPITNLWTGRGYRRRGAAGALLLFSGLGLLAAGGFGLTGWLTHMSWPPELFDLGVLIFWCGVAVGGIAAMALASLLLEPKPQVNGR